MRSTELMPRSIVTLAAVALLLSACGGDKTVNTDSAAAVAAAVADTGSTGMAGDSAPSVEVIPPADAPAAQEPPVAVAAAPKPTAPRPKPARPTGTVGSNTASAPATPSEPARSSGTISAGTTIGVTSGEKVCSNTLQVGDRITATTNAPISGTNGVSIPAGARVGLAVTASKTSSRQGDDAVLTFDVRSVAFGGDTYDVTGSVTTASVVTERAGGDAKKVAIGAGVGAGVGNVVGGGSRTQRTIVGAAAGALGGAVVAAMTGDRLACLPAGSPLTVTVGSALTVRN